MVKYRFIGTMAKFTDTIGVMAPNEEKDLNKEQAEIADKSPEFIRVTRAKQPVKTSKGDE